MLELSSSLSSRVGRLARQVFCQPTSFAGRPNAAFTNGKFNFLSKSLNPGLADLGVLYCIRGSPLSVPKAVPIALPADHAPGPAAAAPAPYRAPGRPASMKPPTAPPATAD